MTLALALSIFVFLTIVVIVFAFGAASLAPSSVLGSRLREIGWQRPKAQTKPAIRERMQQALDPFSRSWFLLRSSVHRIRFAPSAYRSNRVRLFPSAILIEEKATGAPAPDSPRPSRRTRFDRHLRGSGLVSRSG